MPQLPHDPNALAVLMNLQRQRETPRPTQDPFVAKRRKQIFSGEDALAPGQLTQRRIQSQIPGVSREDVRDEGIQLLKQQLGLTQQQAEIDLRNKIIPEQIKGEFGLRQAEVTARAAADRAQENRDAIAARQETSQANMMERLQETLGTRRTLQTQAETARAGRQAPSSANLIARQREALASEVAEAEPTIGRFFGRTNPEQPRLDQFDNTLAIAKAINQEFPNLSTSDALIQLNAGDPSPEELGQIEQFRLLLGQ